MLILRFIRFELLNTFSGLPLIGQKEGYERQPYSRSYRGSGSKLKGLTTFGRGYHAEQRT